MSEIDSGRWYQSGWVLSLTSGLLLWAAFPPLGFTWLAWIAPVGWLQLIRADRLPGSRPYRAIWIGGAAHWLAMLIGITYAHWANVFGWLVLSSYLATYVPIFVALTRVAVHRIRIPLLLAAPVVWTGLELLRGHLFTGFSMALLGHSQFEWTALIQLAAIFGAYGVSFLVMFIAACLVTAIWPRPSNLNDRRPRRERSFFSQPEKRLSPLLLAAAAMVATLGYAASEPETQQTSESLKVALIQDAFNTRFENNPDRNREIFREYRDLTLRTLDEHRDLDLIVWPESVFTANLPEVILKETAAVDDELAELLVEHEAAFGERIRDAARGLNQAADAEIERQLDVSLLVGTETMVLSAERRLHNSALLINPLGEITGRYYKMHPVMFGEYIPLANIFPWLYEITPLPQGLTPGQRPQCFEVNGVRLAPNICFESSVPHLVRGQIVRLGEDGAPPDVLVNLTHDGWFWGSAILDFQLAGTVFRSVELRRPYLVAANAGISAWIDHRGRIRDRGPRQGKAAIIATIRSTGGTSWYATYGDVSAALCLGCCLFLAVAPYGAALVRPPSAARPRTANPSQPRRGRNKGRIAST